MGWEKRPRTDKLYYTRTRRAGGRRGREYFGAGPLGEIAWLVDLLRQLDAELARRRGAAVSPAGGETTLAAATAHPGRAAGPEPGTS